MTRATVLRDLLDNGRDYGTPRLEKAAADLSLPVADLLVIAGHPVPGQLLPPDRDQEILGEFVDRATHCNHPQLAALVEYLLTLPGEGAAPESRPARDLADPDPFPAILDGLMRNRGFGVREFPYVGLSMSTISGMLHGRWHQLRQLRDVAGPLGWRTEDLATLAGEPLRPLDHRPMYCHHFGAVFIAAVPRTTEQLALAADEADRLSGRGEHSVYRSAPESWYDCPDA